jgi:ABC-type uncharacterized transport system substrate-binding protein
MMRQCNFQNGMMRRRSQAWLCLALLALAVVIPTRCAEAHPHVLVDAHTEILFNAQGQMTGITNVWDFDDAFSAFAIQGYDKKGDGLPTRAELQPLAQVNLNSLKEYGYFTRVSMDGANVPFGQPTNFFDVFEHERLTLHFTLPLAKPLDVGGKTFEVNVYDPEYFAAVTFATQNPFKLVGNAEGCTTLLHRPEQLDPQTASRLAVIPADQRELPSDLFAITNKLVNGIKVSCK